MAEKHRRRCSLSSLGRWTLKHGVMLSHTHEHGYNKRPTTDENVNTQNFCTLLMGMENCRTTLENCSKHIPQKLNINLRHSPTIDSLSRCLLNRTKNWCPPRTCAKVFIIASSWKQSRYLSTSHSLDNQHVVSFSSGRLFTNKMERATYPCCDMNECQKHYTR